MTANPAAATASDLVEGKKFAACYLLQQRVSAQPDAEIWRASDEVLGKDVSLHFLPTPVRGDKIAMNALRQEVKRTRALIHPNILRIYDLVEESEWAAIAMDAIEGDSLATILKNKGQLDPADIEPWIGSLCQTLEEAHKINLVHRDLAPANVLVGGSKGFVLAGFGTSRIVQDALSRAAAGGMNPRSSNLSPQLIDAQTPTASDDVYGLGALLFELLTGRPVFVDGDIVQQIRKIAPPKVSEVRAAEAKVAIPAAWDETIASCLNKAHDARPITPAQVAAKLLKAAAPAGKLAEGAPELKTGAAAVTSVESNLRPTKKKPAEILAERAAQHKAGIVEGIPSLTPASVPAPQEAPPAPGKQKPADILAARAAQFKAEGSSPAPQKTAATSEKTAESKIDKPKQSLATPGLDLFLPPRQPRSPVGLVALAALIIVAAAFYYHYRQTPTESGISPQLATTEAEDGSELTAVNHSIAESSGSLTPPVIAGSTELNRETSGINTAADLPPLTPPPSLAEAPVVTLAQNSSARRGTPETSAAPAAVASDKALADKAAVLEKLKQDVAAAEKTHQEKVKAQQEAEAALAETQKALAEKAKAVAPVKKAVEDLLATRKKREDEQKNAEAAAQAAQQLAAEKARAAEDAKKALADFDTQNQEKLSAQKQAEAEMQTMQQTLAEQQKAAADAAKASADAEALREQQTAAIKETEQELGKARAMAEKAAAEAEKKRAAMETERRRLDEELAAMRNMFEQKMKEIEDRRRQLEGGIAPAASLPNEKPVVPATTVENASTVPSPETKPSANVGAESKPVEDPALTLAMKTERGNPPAEVKSAGDENSLGHKFVKIGDVYFSIWQTRVKDFEVFAKAVNLKSNNWRSPGFHQEVNHPVVNVTWNEAIAFCKWLTEKERKEGRLPTNQFYRLPMDLEWSAAVGLSQESGRTPEARDMGVQDFYPWGTQWPPPEGAGNYTGEETGSDVAIKGYNDKFPWTAPVGSFPPNKFGLYDMGGNVWQWCMDSWNNDSKAKVLRGASWYNGALKLSLLASCRVNAAPDSSTDNYGFRIVRAVDSGSRPAKRP